MKNRDLIRDAMMFAVKDITGRVLREATVQSMIDDFEKQLTIPVVVGQSEQLKPDEEPIVKGEQYVADYVAKHGKDLTSL